MLGVSVGTSNRPFHWPTTHPAINENNRHLYRSRRRAASVDQEPVIRHVNRELGKSLESDLNVMERQQRHPRKPRSQSTRSHEIHTSRKRSSSALHIRQVSSCHHLMSPTDNSSISQFNTSLQRSRSSSNDGHQRHESRAASSGDCSPSQILKHRFNDKIESCKHTSFNRVSSNPSLSNRERSHSIGVMKTSLLSNGNISSGDYSIPVIITTDYDKKPVYPCCSKDGEENQEFFSTEDIYKDDTDIDSVAMPRKEISQQQSWFKRKIINKYFASRRKSIC